MELFVEPFKGILSGLMRELSNPNSYNTDQTKVDRYLSIYLSVSIFDPSYFLYYFLSTFQFALTGLLRDIRGIVSACGNKRPYTFVFDWLFPDYFAIFLRAAELYQDQPAVIVALLRLIAELAFNKGGRITFDNNSVNGILLFKETSRILVSYGKRLSICLSFNLY